MSTQRWSASGEVATLFGFGLFLMALGALLFGLPFRSGSPATGSLVLLVLGGVSAVIGQVLVAIGIIAVGVRLGSRD